MGRFSRSVSSSKRNRDSKLPVIMELIWVPIRLLKATAVDRSDAIIDRVDADLVGT